MTNQPLPNRKSTRLPDYSYRTPGAYFVTIRAHEGLCLFGEVVNHEVVLNGVGRIVQRNWLGLSDRWDAVTIDDYLVVMPNHVHGIVIMHEAQDMNKVPRLGDIVARFKSEATRSIRNELVDFRFKVWQRDFYDHIIRDEDELRRIREYIVNNPAQWAEDEYYGLR